MKAVWLMGVETGIFKGKRQADAQESKLMRKKRGIKNVDVCTVSTFLIFLWTTSEADLMDVEPKMEDGEVGCRENVSMYTKCYILFCI